MRGAEKSSGIFLIILIIVIVAAGSLFLYFQLRTDRVSDLLETEEVLKTIIIFADAEGDIVSTQVFLYSNDTYKGALLDIPSHTGSILQTEGRIGSIETLFDRKKPKAFIDKVEEILSTEFDFYLIMDISGFEKAVDIIEGVELFIPNPVEITDTERIVLLPSGNLVLDGSKSVEYIMYTDEGETYTDHAGRKQKLVQSFMKSLGERSELLTHKKVRPYINNIIDTDVSSKGLSVFFRELGSLDVERMVLLKMRGTTRLVDNEELLFPHSNGNLIRETLRQTVDSLSNEDIFSDEELNISVEVLNGTNQNGLASRTSQIFQSFGYEIKKIGNADTVYEKTEIIDNKGDLPSAQRLAKIIRCNNISSRPVVEEGIEEIVSADITIIIGKDFDGRYCKE